MYLPLLKHALFIGSACSATTFPLVFSLGTNIPPEGGGVQPKMVSQNLDSLGVTTPSIPELISEVDKELQPQVLISQRTGKVSHPFKNENFRGLKTISKKEKELNKGNELAKEKSENKAEDTSYRDFLRYFWEILRRTLWVDGINSVPWIHSVKATLPSNKSSNLTNYITKRNLSSNIVEVEVEFGREAVRKLREWGTRYSSSVTTGIRKGMEEAFLRFVDLNWNLDTSLLTKDSNINKLARVSLALLSSSKGEYPTHTIRFIREDEGQIYYLDCVFNSRLGENQLYIPHIWTGKEFYAANGEEGASKKYIGGKVNPNNVFDREFANMFSSPVNLHKQLTVIGECLVNYSTCGAIFPMSSYYTLPWNSKDKPLSRIHPLSDIFWKVDEKWKAKPPLVWANYFGLIKFLNGSPRGGGRLKETAIWISSFKIPLQGGRN